MKFRIGSAKARSRLTEGAVRYIRSTGRHRRSLAYEFGVTPASIDAVRARRTWWWLR